MSCHVLTKENLFAHFAFVSSVVARGYSSLASSGFLALVFAVSLDGCGRSRGRMSEMSIQVMGGRMCGAKIPGSNMRRI